MSALSAIEMRCNIALY